METQPLLCLLGSILINLTLGTFYSVGNVLPYIASYMRIHVDNTITTESLSYVNSTFLLGQSLFLVVGAWIESHYNSRIAIILGCVIHSFSTFMTIYALNTSFTLVILFYGFGCGLGTGSAYMASIIAAQKWYPNRKGTFTGIIVAGFGLGGFVFTSLQTLYVNPDNVAKNKDKYFDSSVADRTPNLFTFMGLIFAVMQIIGVIMHYPPPKCEQDNQPSDNNNVVLSDDVLPKVRTFNDVFKYRIFYIAGLLFILLAPGVTFVNSLGKRYGEIFIEDDKFLAIVISFAAIGNAGGRISWGLLLDYFSFTTCLSLDAILFSTLILIFPLQTILSSKILYFLATVGLYFGFSATFVLLPVFIERIFGSRYGGIIYGSLYILLALSSIVTSFLIDHVLSPNLINEKAELTSNRIVPCLMIASLYIFCLILYYFLLPTRRIELAIARRKETERLKNRDSLYQREDLYPYRIAPPPHTLAQTCMSQENSLGSIVRFRDNDLPNKVNTIRG